MTEIVCLLPKPTMEIECLCFDTKPCDIRINDGGHLVCRHGSNEGVVEGIAQVICPLEIANERLKWEAFIESERRQETDKK
ncbi:MAG: hypothetical protein NWE93_04100 [Candidatus Bathyarchaeota archaeon]|nr:hypothetical protein [Candidatus Bathyarchaeota archaeon]